jgi:hypothetical protein
MQEILAYQKNILILLFYVLILIGIETIGFRAQKNRYK